MCGACSCVGPFLVSSQVTEKPVNHCHHCAAVQARLAALPWICLCWTPLAWWPGSASLSQQQMQQQGQALAAYC